MCCNWKDVVLWYYHSKISVSIRYTSTFQRFQEFAWYSIQFLHPFICCPVSWGLVGLLSVLRFDTIYKYLIEYYRLLIQLQRAGKIHLYESWIVFLFIYIITYIIYEMCFQIISRCFANSICKLQSHPEKKIRETRCQYSKDNIITR